MSTTDRSSSASLLVVIPCLNEGATIRQVVAGVPDEIPGIGTIEVVVLDDGSTDETAMVAREAGAGVVSNPRNLGLGQTFQRAVRLALDTGADILINIDGDGQFDPADIPRLAEPILRGQADMVTASRFVDPSLTPEMPRLKKWGNHRVAQIVSAATGERFHDVSCGFRAFSREALLRLNLFGSFTYTQETFLDLAYKQLEILEVPIAVRGTREHGESRIASSLSSYAYRSLKIMFRAAISYKPLRFFAAIASVFLVFGFALLAFLLVHYLDTGAFSPHRWAGFVGGSFGFLGILTLVLGLLGDMLVRIRLNQEEILYLLRLEGKR